MGEHGETGSTMQPRIGVAIDHRHDLRNRAVAGHQAGVNRGLAHPPVLLERANIGMGIFDRPAVAGQVARLGARCELVE
jgi:hypothetical protein